MGPQTNRIATKFTIINSNTSNNIYAKSAITSLKSMNETSIHVTASIRSATPAMISKWKKKKGSVQIVWCIIKLIGLKNINRNACNLLNHLNSRP